MPLFLVAVVITVLKLKIHRPVRETWRYSPIALLDSIIELMKMDLFFFPFRILILHKDCSWSFLALEGAAALVRGRPDGDQVCQFLGLSIEAVIVSFLGSIE